MHTATKKPLSSKSEMNHDSAEETPPPPPQMPTDKDSVPIPSAGGTSDMPVASSNSVDCNTQTPAPTMISVARQTFKEKKRIIASKAPRARYPLLVVAACLAWMVLGLFTFDVGIQGVRGTIKPKFEEAHRHYYATQNQNRQDQYIHGRLYSLLGKSLDKPLFETHNECLARAITIADAHYLGQPYQKYGNILNQTIEWAEFTCAKLSFTPQMAYPPARTLLRITWLALNEKSVQAYQTVKHATITGMHRIKTWIDVRILRKKQNAEYEAPPLEGEVNRDRFSKRTSLEVPLNFVLNCDHGPICRILYTSPPKQSPVTDVISFRTVAKSKHTLDRLGRILRIINVASSWNRALLIWLLIPLETIALTAMAVTSWCPLIPPDWAPGRIADPVCAYGAKLTWSRERRTERVLAAQMVCIMLGAAFTSFCMNMCGVVMGWVAALLVVTGLSVVTAFFVPMKAENETIYNLIGAINKLYNIWHDSDPLPPPAKVSNESAKKKSTSFLNIPSSTKPVPLETAYPSDIAEPSDNDTSSSTSSETSATNTRRRRRLTPKTSLQEDVEQVRQRMHAEAPSELKANTTADTEHDPAPLEDVELSDRSNRSDRSDGSDPGSDWSVV